MIIGNGYGDQLSKIGFKNNPDKKYRGQYAEAGVCCSTLPWPAAYNRVNIYCK
jgi:hypothetical protein